MQIGFSYACLFPCTAEPEHRCRRRLCKVFIPSCEWGIPVGDVNRQKIKSRVGVAVGGDPPITVGNHCLSCGWRTMERFEALFLQNLIRGKSRQEIYRCGERGCGARRRGGRGLDGGTWLAGMYLQGLLGLWGRVCGSVSLITCRKSWH